VIDSVGGIQYDSNICSIGSVGVTLDFIEGMEPGPELVSVLAAMEREGYTDYDRVVALKAYTRLASHFQAKAYEQIAAISDLICESDGKTEEAFDSAVAEVRAALHLTRRAAEEELTMALQLCERLPQVWGALAAGALDLRRARVLTEGTSHLATDLARQVVDRVIEPATRLTTGQIRALLRKVCIEADPEEAVELYETALEGRRVFAEPTIDGTANLMGLDLPPERVAAVMSKLTQLAESLRRGGEDRSLDQLRADIFLDLLNGRQLSGRGHKGSVNLHVDLATLAGLAESPGELGGFGPVVADVARQVTEQQQDTTWRWTVTDSETGQPIHNGTTRRRPTPDQRRHVEARNPTCIFPGCRMPATDCDLDHRIPWSQGGPTTIDQLEPLCRHDHVIRQKGWKHQPLQGGDHLWTSRLGHLYTTSGRSP
jgi:hypothetical protein